VKATIEVERTVNFNAALATYSEKIANSGITSFVPINGKITPTDDFKKELVGQSQLEDFSVRYE
jgi:hypothetical protein